MKRLLVITALISGLILGVGPAANAAPSGPPIPADPNFSAVCGSGPTAFTVTGVVTGTFKNIVSPSGTIISTSPGLKITLTANGKTLNYVITGVLFITVLSDRLEVVATGLNLLTVPGVGLFLTKGNVNFAVILDGNSEVRRFIGVVQVTDVCALLS
jgi:hypothetical protein